MEQNRSCVTYSEFLQWLHNAAEEPFAQFQRRLIPGETILGVRTPLLRTAAKKIAKGDWRRFLEEAGDATLEETIAQGLVTGFAKMNYEESLARTAAFVPKIKSWASCDICCSSFRFLKQNRERSFEFLHSYLHGSGEFSVRFGIIALMDYFTDNEFLPRCFEALDEVQHEGYYVRMAQAWAVSVWYVKYPKETGRYLAHCGLDDWTFNKGLQKITESNRVDAAAKAEIRAMKRPKRL